MGSIASRGSNTDLYIHDLEQLVYKVENQQGLWDISTCTNSDMGDIYYVSKVSKSTISSVSTTRLFDCHVSLESTVSVSTTRLFDCHVSLESTVNSQSLVGVDQSMEVSNLTHDSTTLYSVHMLKQNIVQSCCDSIPYGSNLFGNWHRMAWYDVCRRCIAFGIQRSGF